MQVENWLIPSEEQMAGFAEPGPGGPIYMLNLLKYREFAAYEDGSDADLSGRKAYERYGAAVMELMPRFGAGLVLNGKVSRLMLGAVEDLWDDVAIAMYPSRQAMLDMMMSDDYQAISVHRSAGLEGQLNIELTDTLLLSPPQQES